MAVLCFLNHCGTSYSSVKFRLALLAHACVNDINEKSNSWQIILTNLFCGQAGDYSTVSCHVCLVQVCAACFCAAPTTNSKQSFEWVGNWISLETNCTNQTPLVLFACFLLCSVHGVHLQRSNYSPKLCPLALVLDNNKTVNPRYNVLIRTTKKDIVSLRTGVANVVSHWQIRLSIPA